MKTVKTARAATTLMRETGTDRDRPAGSMRAGFALELGHRRDHDAPDHRQAGGAALVHSVFGGVPVGAEGRGSRRWAHVAQQIHGRHAIIHERLVVVPVGTLLVGEFLAVAKLCGGLEDKVREPSR